MPETFLYRGLRSLFGALSKGSKEIPGIGDAASYYFTKLGEYTTRNLAPSLKYDYSNEYQRAEDVPISNELESAIGKKYKGAGDLGPRSLKAIAAEASKNRGSLGPGSTRILEQTREPDMNYAREMLPIFFGHQNTLYDQDSHERHIPPDRPEIGVEWVKDTQKRVNFNPVPAQGPNAAFATTGPPISRRKKIYQTVI